MCFEPETRAATLALFCWNVRCPKANACQQPVIHSFSQDMGGMGISEGTTDRKMIFESRHMNIQWPTYQRGWACYCAQGKHTV
ncbi:hypothetical protein CVT26_004937 [Gymnopilus dilepis]|uniref:Uncharacterized protein n=1 Tax=Gymnopilus dilepis TaxID=231916 RepID=A0A409YJ59_9AGAR|nr:hypothetical protein CVT26_004937 [Gymnopilus dilepis]